ncbi:MAG: ATP-binding protein [Bacteroidota bacterium]
MKETISNQIRALPEADQRVLKYAACFSDGFRAALLTELFALEAHRTRQSLDLALKRGWLAESDTTNGAVPRLHFPDPEIKSSAYALMDPIERATTHHRIANYLEGRIDPESGIPAQTVFFHFNQSLEHLQSDRERQRFVRVGIQAAEDAIYQEHLEAANAAIATARTILPPHRTGEWRSLHLKLSYLAYQSAGQSDDQERLHQIEQEILQIAQTPSEQAAFFLAKAQYCYPRRKWPQLMAALQSGLSSLQFDLATGASAKQTNREWQRLRGQYRSRQADLLRMAAWKNEEATQLAALWRLTYWGLEATAPQEMTAFAVQAMKAVLQHGFHAEGSLAFYLFARYNAMTTHPSVTAGILRTGVQIADRIGLRGLFYTLSQVMQAEVEGAPEVAAQQAQRGYEEACAAQNWEDAAGILPDWALSKLQIGVPLHDLEAWLGEQMAYLQRVAAPNSALVRQHIALMRGTAYLAPPHTASESSRAVRHLLRLQRAVILRDLEPLQQALATYDPAVEGYPGGEFDLWTGLGHALLAFPQTGSARRRRIQHVRDSLDRLGPDPGPKRPHRAYRCALLQSALQDLNGNARQAEAGLRRAIALARNANSYCFAAIAAEWTAQHLLTQPGNQSAEIDGLLQQSYEDFRRWGSLAKAQQMHLRYGLRVGKAASPGTAPPPIVPTSSPPKINGTVSIAPLMEIARETSSSASIQWLTRVTLELGQRLLKPTYAALLLWQKGRWMPISRLSRTRNAIEVLDKSSFAANLAPAQVLDRVRQDRAVVLRQDAARDPDFAPDPYFHAQQPASLIALPLQHKDTVHAVLYLEGDQLEWGKAALEGGIAEFLAGQAAIALTNVVRFERLEENVRQRASELEETLEFLRTTQDQLMQSEKLASLGQVTAGIAHEIRNPLNFVNNFSELSIELAQELREELEERQNKLLDREAIGVLEEYLDDLASNAEKIQHHGKRAESIVHNMLMHAASGQGEVSRVDLNKLTKEYTLLAYHGIRGRLTDFTCQLKFDLDERIGEVNLRQQDISRALLNIFQNAFQAMEEKRHTVDYSPQLEVASTMRGDRVELRIRDNGPGIPEAVRNRIFEPFFTTKPTGKGTGLGLSLAHELVVQGHGGTLEVSSSPGSYTEFIIVLPNNHEK